MGPGSLFTSIVPNLLVRDVANAVARTSALKMYVCNVAGEPGETEGYSIVDHLNVIRHYAGESSVELVIANNNLHQPNGQDQFELIQPKDIWEDKATYISADVIDENSPSRHDPVKLALAISEAYRKNRGKRRRLPRLQRNLDLAPITANRSGTVNGTEA